MNFAFLSQGKLYIVDGNGAKRELQSQFAEKARERAARNYDKHAWKGAGGGGFLGGSMLWGRSAGAADPGNVKVNFTGLSRGPKGCGLTYTLETDQVSGVFELEPDYTGERRLAHRAEKWPTDVDVHPESGMIACAVRLTHSVCNIGVLQPGSGGISEVTEGDCADGAPHWVPGTESELVFHSAGVARNRSGVAVGLGPYRIEHLNVHTGTMETLAEDPESDLLSPRMDRDGNLYYVRRPYRPIHNSPKLSRTLLDVVLFPFRLCLALFHWLNFFSMRNSGQPLSTSGNAQQKHMDLQRMLIWGNLINAEQAIKAAQAEDSPDLVPRTWKLIKRSQNGVETVVASGVLSYDLLSDGSILYSNGSAIFQLVPDQKPRQIHRHAMIEQVVAVQ